MDSHTESSFSSGYLTLTSLVQATVFAVFVLSLRELAEKPGCEWLRHLPFLASEFLTIIVVCLGYLIGSRDLRWRMDLLDVAIPCSMGLTQCAAILALGVVTHDIAWWFICYAVLDVLFLSAGINALHKTPRTSGVLLARIRPFCMAFCVQFVVLLILAVCAYQETLVMTGGIFVLTEMVVLLIAVQCFGKAACPTGHRPHLRARRRGWRRVGRRGGCPARLGSRASDLPRTETEHAMT